MVSCWQIVVGDKLTNHPLFPPRRRVKEMFKTVVSAKGNDSVRDGKRIIGSKITWVHPFDVIPDDLNVQCIQRPQR